MGSLVHLDQTVVRKFSHHFVAPWCSHFFKKINVSCLCLYIYLIGHLIHVKISAAVDGTGPAPVPAAGGGGGGAATSTSDNLLPGAPDGKIYQY